MKHMPTVHLNNVSYNVKNSLMFLRLKIIFYQMYTRNKIDPVTDFLNFNSEMFEINWF